MSATVVQSIPMSQIVEIDPSVLSAGGAALDMNGLFFINERRTPAKRVLAFPTYLSVANYYGANSTMAKAAAVYFAGYDNSFKKPGTLLTAQFPNNAHAWLRGGSGLATMALATMQALSGILTISMDGTSITTQTFNLNDCNSPSDVAEKISYRLQQDSQTVSATAFTGSITSNVLTVTAINTNNVIALNGRITGAGIPSNIVVTGQLSGTTGGIGTYSTTTCPNISSESMNSLNASYAGTHTASLTGVIATNTLTASGVTGTINFGDELVSLSTAGRTQIVSQLTGTTGKNGTYLLSGSPQTVSSESMNTNTPLVTFDTVSGGLWITSTTQGAAGSVSVAAGTLSGPLFLSAGIATVSPGVDNQTPSDFMNSITAITQNWASFTHLWDPDADGQDTIRLEFAQWVSQQNNRYLYVTARQDMSDNFGAALAAGGYSGVCNILSGASDEFAMAAFVMGWAASLDFNRRNGRATAAFRHQAGLAPDVTDALTASTALASGYNFMGQYSTANQDFNWLYNGKVSGAFSWLDSYVNQIYLNNQFQLALVLLLDQVGSIPYNDVGDALIHAAMMDPILQAGNFGTWRAGVTLSQAQAAEVNFIAGVTIDNILSTQGWYLQILDATPQVRAARGSPPINFWYMDGGSVQKLQVASILVQ